MRDNQRRTGQNPEVTPNSSVPTAHQPAPLAFSAPTEFVILPSRGEFYSEDHPLYKQETIEIRFMTAKDEDILTSEALLKKNLALDRLLDSLIVVEVDASSLLLGDRNAILISARASAYGSDYPVTLRCEKCASTTEAEYDLRSVQTQENCFDKQFLREKGVRYDRQTMTFDVTLPSSGVEVGVQLIDGKKEKKILERENKNLITGILSSFLVKVNGDTNYDRVMDFLDLMPASDSKFLRDLFPLLAPNVKLTMMHRCEACFHIKEQEVPLSAGFFWPD
tara:strand:- start:1197 stop:2033 length:837 start_codon:yes stop_codon:yes gene_type:complete